MTVTNTDEVKEAVDDSEVSEQDLRDLKYGNAEVEDSNESDETDETKEEETETSEETEEESTEEEAKSDDEEETSFVKEFPNIKGDTPEEYSKNLEIAYKNSTAEFQRLRAEGLKTKPEEAEDTDSNVASLYAKQKMDEEIMTAYTDFSKKYPQVNDESEYSKFTNEVATLSSTILSSQKRLASPNELYQKAAVILGWEPNSPTSQDKLDAKVLDTAANSKTNGGKAKVSKSKVTDAMIAANRKMYPNKSDAEIREELEPYVN